MKHVKKSMFISTVLMVVMLIAALSTATFAWYTSNNTAASKSTTVGAAQANDANIGIGFYVGAQDNTIEFYPLADGNNGNLSPVAPTTYFHEYTTNANASQVLSDTYTTSTRNDISSSDYVANGVNGNNYRRVVQMTNAQVNSIVAQASYTHNKDTGILTNLKAGVDFNGNYEHIYKVAMYAYNNGVAVGAAGAPAVGNAISVSSYNYEKLSAATDETCYKVEKVYQVSNDAQSANLPSQITSETTAITQYCANQLAQSINANFTPNGGTYLVMYYEYHVVPYTVTNVTDADVNAIEVGYAGDTALQLNSTEHDIQAINVINQPTTYPTTGLGSSAVGISAISYNNQGFAYLYKTFTGGNQAFSVVTNGTGNTWTGFTFSKASVDNVGYFKPTTIRNATIGEFYSGVNEASTIYNAAAGDLGVIQGKAATANAEPTRTFYVTNNGTTNIATLTVSVTVTGDNANLLRIAVFRDHKYYGTLSAQQNAPTTFGKILEGARAADMPKYLAYSSIDLGELQSGPDHAAEFQLVAWFDGTGLNDQAAGKNCAFTLNFTATV